MSRRFEYIKGKARQTNELCVLWGGDDLIMDFLLFNWWQYTKYILFSNHFIWTPGHLCCRTLSRQRSKQNLFLPITTWQTMYINISGRQPASSLRSIAQWICSCHFSTFHYHTPKGFPFGGSSRVPGCWHPRSSCSLHYSFFTHAKPW